MKSSKIRGDQFFSLTLDRGQHFLKVFESILVKKVKNQKTLKNVGKLFEGPLKSEKICGHLLNTFWHGGSNYGALKVAYQVKFSKLRGDQFLSLTLDRDQHFL